MGDFEESARRVSGGEVGSVSRENQLQLYAYYSVATKGGAPARGPSPYLDPRGGAKWQAWDAASHLSRDDARRRYVALVEELESVPAGERAGDPSGAEGPGAASSLRGFTVSGDRPPPPPRLDLTHWASVNDTKSLAFCLDSQAVSPDYRDEDGLTALMRAADRDAADALRLLLAAGAAVGAADGDGQTALHYASLCDHARIAAMLVCAGADADARDADGATPRDAASAEVRAAMDAAARGEWADPGAPHAEVAAGGWRALRSRPRAATAGAAAVCVGAVAAALLARQW